MFLRAVLVGLLTLTKHGAGGPDPKQVTAGEQTQQSDQKPHGQGLRGAAHEVAVRGHGPEAMHAVGVGAP
jgi:hypothetical protein